MTRTKIIAAALAVLAIGATAAEAGCKPNQVASKTFVMSATDSSDVNKFFFMCGFTTSAAGTVSLDAASVALFAAAMVYSKLLLTPLHSSAVWLPDGVAIAAILATPAIAQARKKAPTPPSPALFEALEPRLLLSADAVGACDGAAAVGES